MEPFSTSVFKICTRGCFTRAYAPSCATASTPSYSSELRIRTDGRVSAQFGTLTRLSVHPASPVLLTKNGPHGALITWRGSIKQPNPYLFKV
ncbi:unnamed protein product [Bathycoccus prasinos]